MQYIFKGNIANYSNIEHDIRDLFEKVRLQPFNVEYINVPYAPYVWVEDDIIIAREIFLYYCKPYVEVPTNATTILKMLCDYLGKTQEQLVESLLQERKEFESINKAIKEYEEKYSKKFTIT